MRSKYFYYFGLAMVAVYLILGILLLIFDLPLNVTRSGQLAVGGVLIVYGLMRGFMIWRKRNHENEE
jgi:hypothetical protein